MTTYFFWTPSIVTPLYTRSTRYEQQIANAQELEREALKLATFAETFAEGSIQYQIQMQKAEQAYREGARYYAAAQKAMKHA